MSPNNNISIHINPSEIQKSSPVAHQRFLSFDGGVAAQGLLQRPDRYRFWTPGPASNHSIPRGAGLSYAAASFCTEGLSIEHGSFNRILDFDSDQHIIEVEAGIELSALYDFLSTHNLYLPIQPGHGRITVGGCIATDVHGKNHAKDGTFINQVVGLTLFHPDQGMIEVSPEIEPALFRLTCGGYGLTGHILKARLRASPVPSDVVEISAVQVENVSSGIRQFLQTAPEADFTYTWHDFMTQAPHFGRGYIFVGHFLPPTEKNNPVRIHRASALPALSAQGRTDWRLPLLNPFTNRGMNFAYRSKQHMQGKTRRVSLYNALFPIHETQFYFKLFGSRGFHEYQIVLPKEHMDAYVNAVHDYLSRHPHAITLASAKLFKGQQELLRFTGNGVCFALNFPRTSETPSFLEFLDKLLISLGGIPNIIKDSRLPRAVMEACYPETARFREQLHAFDPKRLFRSELSERLGL